MAGQIRRSADAAGPWRGLRAALLVLAFCAAYFLAARLGIATRLPPEGIVVVWPPNAIVLTALLATRRAGWPVLFVATVATEIAADVPDYPLWAATGYGTVNFLEAAIAAALLSRAAPSAPPLLALKDFAAFVATGPFVASGLAALFGALIYKLGAPELDYLHYWRVFWIGDALGLLILGTILLSWRRPAVAWGRSVRLAAAEGAALSLGLLLAAGWAFLAELYSPRVYLIFPFLLWAALRFGVRGASAAILFTVAAAIGSALAGVGPFAQLSAVSAVLALQGMIAAVCLSAFALAFAIEDSLRAAQQLARKVVEQEETASKLRGAYGELERINRDLDRIVADRTKALEGTLARNVLLFRELQHRVKNNLQLVSSLLTLQGQDVKDAAAREKFDEVQRQIGAIAATYEILHQMQSVETVDFRQIVPSLCASIGRAFGGLLSLSVETDGPAPVSAQTAVSLALALNELITNSAKHGGRDGRSTVRVRCGRAGDRVLLSVADDGPGFPPGFDLERAAGFGLRMVRSVAAQAQGEVALPKVARGACVEIAVPAAAPSAASAPAA